MSHAPVSIIGLGAMGRALATVLLDAGHPVTIWNRTANKQQALIEQGAIGASTPEEAAHNMLIILCVTDYAASQEILDNLGPALHQKTLINLTTSTPEEAQNLAKQAENYGARYLDGVIQASPAHIGSPTATLFFAGAFDTFSEHAAALTTFGTIRYVGANPGQASLYDMALLGLWYDAEMAYFNALSLIGGRNADLDAFLPFAHKQFGYVIDALTETTQEVQEQRYPKGPASLVEHSRVLHQLAELRQSRGMDTGQLDHLNAIVDQLIADGAGNHGFTQVSEKLVDGQTR
ncbi:MAG: NAD(P)-binding domain-containing protein [Corynebacteriales bacterium]|nr:NAD(P)-binding domain-containing protein [Mycobacteriales bacterium]